VKGIPRVAISDSAREHEALGADKAITDAIDRHVQTERDSNGEGDGATGDLAPAG
jgi:uncharacterized protein (DUF2345 family)